MLAHITSCLFESTLTQQELAVTHQDRQLFANNIQLKDSLINRALCERFVAECDPSYLNSFAITVEDINFNSITLSATLFVLLFLSAGLPSYAILRYKTPKSILELKSFLLSWIKPVKGTPS
ncbi:hypothetical protein L2747_18075 [Shewanella marinintestina]|uniref:hypothetical protein n=1 Tax=Shewanella marinintestina TaxID=190305 RepID=UPI00200E9403|nr:hypothetical protein [Shewanella marinintestina]MCL1147919.1 hypothetical protein [Shewanella marinintestina]